MHVFFGSRTPAPSCKPRDSEGFCLYPTSKPGHLWRGQVQTWSLQSAQQLLTRAVDRGAQRCVQVSSEAHSSRWLWGQSACRAIAVEETQRGGRPGLAGGHSPAGGTSSSKDLSQGLYCRVSHRCLWDSHGIVDLLLETKTHRYDVLHTILGASETPPPEQCMEPQ